MSGDRSRTEYNTAGPSSESGTRSSSHADSVSQQSAGPTRRDQLNSQGFGYNDPQPVDQIGEPASPVDTKSRKPPIPRRASSKHLPRRGLSFSVDDASQEVDDDALQTRPASVRRHPSTVRRRTTAQPTPLPFIHSADAEECEEDDDQDQTQQTSATDTSSPEGLERSQTSIDNVKKNTGETEAQQDDVDDQQDTEIGGGDEEEDEDEDEDSDVSDSESFTLKDRQEAINETHPFGIRIWKPALYKKGRSVEKDAEGDIHSTPGGHVSPWLLLFNFAWTVVFGWWLAVFAGIGALLCHLFAFAPGCQDYGSVLWGLARYIFYPFGKYVKLVQEEAYADEDEGEGRSISEYERWQNGDLEEGRLFFGPVRSLAGRQRSDEDSDDETTSLLGRSGRGDTESASHPKNKKRLFGRGQWNLGRVIFFGLFYGILTPCLSIVSLICWLLVFTIPMGRVTIILLRHLRRRPLALEFHADSTYTRAAGSSPSSIILCTYRAVGTRYWKYTIDGTNIFLINLLGVVAFTIMDYWLLYTYLGIRSAITDTIFVFLLALFSIIPLAYFIGQAVASISAQSTMGVGAAINAFFSTIVEVYLYCVALKEGKAPLVEGSLIGSVFAGILFLPGISMCFGAIKRKTQRFNVRSAGVTSTMLLFGVIGAFAPTLFYQIYGSHEMNCHQCTDDNGDPTDRDCRRCFFAQVPAVHDPFYLYAVRPYCWFAAVLLFLSYIIGLFFTLRTHAATIWNSELDEKRPEKIEPLTPRPFPNNTQSRNPVVDYGTQSAPLQSVNQFPSSLPKSDIRDSLLYKRVLGQSLKQAGFSGPAVEGSDHKSPSWPQGMDGHIAFAPATKSDAGSTTPKRQSNYKVPGFSSDDSNALIRQMAELAATAAAVAARDATQTPRKTSMPMKAGGDKAQERPPGASHKPSIFPATPGDNLAAAADHPGGGHDAPNWGRLKSCTVLLSATLAYAIIAEILVNTVDAVLENVDVDQKFLGITLFALVPNTTEFLNAISFAMNGNIALSMEIGSAYALQVLLLQIPAVVLFSAVHGRYLDPEEIIDHTFSLIFPQWDMVTVILCTFLLSYMYGEGKSNYFKGSILILSYLVVVVGFYLTGFDSLQMTHVRPNNGGSYQSMESRSSSKVEL